jgi:DNA invertase Pin-like site-specific DNA recombinase
MRRIVSYIRISTDALDKSGQEIEKQREAIARFAAVENYDIVAEHIDIETVTGGDALEGRPVLAAALAQARKRKAAVAVASLCRLSREVECITGMMAQQVPIIVTELGADGEPFMLNIYATLSENQRGLIMGRARGAFEKKSAAMVSLTHSKTVQPPSATANVTNAAARAANMLAVVRQIQAGGVKTPRTIAEILNARGVRTARGKMWDAATVRILLSRA